MKNIQLFFKSKHEEDFPFLGVWAEEEVSTFEHMSERVEIIDKIDDDNDDDDKDNKKEQKTIVGD